MTRFRFALLLAVLVGSDTHAQVGKDDFPVGSAMHTLFVVGDERDAADKLLDEASARLAQLVSDSHIGFDQRLHDAVVEQAAVWKTFRNADCQLSGAINGGASAWPLVDAMECEMRLTDDRRSTLRSVEACILAIDADQRRFTGSNCLQQLRMLDDHPPRH